MIFFEGKIEKKIDKNSELSQKDLSYFEALCYNNYGLL